MTALKELGPSIWQGEKVAPEHKEMVTAYFSDIVGFTDLSSTLDSSKVLSPSPTLSYSI
jgi:hypothetical protein